MVTYSVGGTAQSAQIRDIHYWFEAVGSDEDISETCAAIDDDILAWWERLSSWLDTYTGLNLLGHGNQETRFLGRQYLASTRHEDGTVRPVNSPGKAVMPWPKLIQVPDSSDLARCFELAGAGAVLPPEWQYLRDAESWLHGGQHRRAVIDACTAAEIALANQAHLLMAGTDATVIEELLTRCTGVADVAKLVRTMGGRDATASRNSIENKLARIRNLAAHAGHEPNRVDARTAVEVAIDVVQHARPREGLYQQAL
ncbi:hypothetical protein [Nocardia sp. BMG51109]|uniref:hypothetical protein n=1 Tax=Nocardia sp. BMG51109 TaxID=1056816 RepID=UPI0004651088|nr:hypothetical protein [Nocardia sp. BMG51109]